MCSAVQWSVSTYSSGDAHRALPFHVQQRNDFSFSEDSDVRRLAGLFRQPLQLRLCAVVEVETRCRHHPQLKQAPAQTIPHIGGISLDNSLLFQHGKHAVRGAEVQVQPLGQFSAANFAGAFSQLFYNPKGAFQGLDVIITPVRLLYRGLHHMKLTFATRTK